MQFKNINNNIIVSICCITYNHEDYIRDSIEGFLMQEVDFPIEIIIHDDASTDQTADIIRKYEKKHPDLINPIYQEENQFSQGVRGIAARFIFPKAKGKYIALCEGDDYWTDPNKLQKQVKFMEKNKKLSGCFHAFKKDYQSSKRIKIVRHKGREIFDLGYHLKKNVFMTTGSLLFKKVAVKKIPEWYYSLFAGDFSLKYFILMEGKIGYIDQVMSVYRKGVPGSWSKQQLTQKKIDKEFHDNLLALFKINEATNYRYNWEVLNKVMALYSKYITRNIIKVSKYRKVYLFVKNILLMRIVNLKMLGKEILNFVHF